MTTAPVGPISLGSVNANWPAMSLAVAFPDGPGPAAPSADWTELSTDGLTIDTARGTDQYEFSDVAAGTMDVLFDNLDGSLDPTNTASPHWPNVKLYRQIRLQATWQGVTYPIFTGNVERWPQQYVAHGRRAQVPLTAVDSLAVMQPGQLANLLAQQMLSYSPAYYFPLDEPAGSTAFADVSGNAGSPQLGAVQYRSGGTYTAGQTSTLTDQVGAVSFASAAGGGVDVTEVYMLRGANTSPGWANAANGFWVSFWFATTMPPPPADIENMMVSLDNGQWQNNYSCYFYLSAANKVGIGINDPVNGFGDPVGSNVNDGKWHHVAFRHNPTGPYYREAWFDGVRGTVDTRAAPLQNYGYLYLSVGGAFRSNATFGFVGSICQLAVLPNTSSFSPADVYAAGINGFAGDTVGGRISRLLTLTGWAGPTSLGTSTTTEQAATGLAGTSLADGCKQAAYDGNGVLFVNSAGTLTYADRTARFNPAPTVTFGENSGGGETPYTTLELDYGPEYVYNDVQVTVNNGTTATTVNATSKDEYEDRVLTQTVNLQNPGEATDRAAYLAARYAQPAYRVAKLTVDLAANPAAFPAVLGLDIGSCVTVNRRPPGGSEISFPAFVERVEHHIAPGAWTCDLMCSPASGLTFWRLDDPVYSQLDHNYPIAY